VTSDRTSGQREVILFNYTRHCTSRARRKSPSSSSPWVDSCVQQHELLMWLVTLLLAWWMALFTAWC